MSPLRFCRVFTGLLLLALPCVAYAGDEFSQFRIPANSYLDWTGGASAFGSWGRQEAGPDRFSSSDWRGGLSSALSRWSEDDHRSALWDAALSVSGLHYRRSTLEHGPYYFGSGDYEVSEDQTQRATGERATVSTQQSWYPGGGPWAVTGLLNSSIDDGQNWDRRRSLTRQVLDPLEPTLMIRSDNAETYRSTLNASLGIGFGRVRNATGVFETRVLEERLRRLGAITRPLSKHARERLSALMYARDDVSQVSSRPASPVMDAVERILFEDGALRDSVLTAAELFHVTEPIFQRYGFATSIRPDGLPQSPFNRMTGWSMNALVTTGHSRLSQRRSGAGSTIIYAAGVPEPPIETRSSSSSKRTSDGTRLSLLAEYHRPSGMRTQWDASTTFDDQLGGGERAYALTNLVRWNFIVADRWLAAASASQSRSIRRTRDHVTLDDSWSAGVGASLQYLVWDHVGLGVGAGESWSKSRDDRYWTNYVDPHAATWSDGGSFSFDITYRFAGMSRIAGVIPAGAQ